MTKRRAFITGGVRRIGALFAKALASHGWDLTLLTANSADTARRFAEELEAQHGVSVTYEVCDLSDTDAVGECFERVTNLGGPVSVLINNSAQFDNDVLIKNPEAMERSPAELSIDGWLSHHKVNVLAPVLLAQAFARQWLNDEHSDDRCILDPCIVNVVDQRVLRPNPMFFSYLAAKSMLNSLTVTMAQALAPHVRVNSIAPGMIYRAPRQSEDNFRRQSKSTLLARSVDPNDLVSCLHFLLSTPSVTGQTIAIDNGQHLIWKTPDVAPRGI